MRNPYATVPALLGVSAEDYEAARAAVETWLRDRPGLAIVEDRVARQQHPLLTSDRIWHSIRRDLGAE